MNEPIIAAAARCAGCGKAYRVPDLGRTYTCRACGGAVRAVEGTDHPEPPAIEGTVTCTECDAVSPAGVHFCVECGATLEESTPLPGSDAAHRLRQEATVALKRADKWIATVTLLYRLGAAAYGMAAMFAVLALARPDVPPGPGLVVVALTTLMSVLLLLGALHLALQPLAWTVALALLATGVSAAHFFGPDPYGLASVASACWAVAGWGALLPTLRVQRWIATHKDLYVLAHASSQTRRALRGHDAHERHERLLAAMRRAGRRAWRVSALDAGAICVLVALGSAFVLQKLRPQELSPAVAQFEAAWDAGDLDGIEALFDPQMRELQAALLGARWTGHGWRRRPPTLSDGRLREQADRAWVDYTAGEVDLTAGWLRVGQRWSLVEVALPPPPLAPVFERFAAAWRAGDVEALSGFYRPDAREEMSRSIEASAAGRGWERFPSVVGSSLSDPAADRASGTLMLERGEVATEWHFGLDGAWRLFTLRFPKR